MTSMLISGLIPLLQQSGLMLWMEEEREKMLEFFMITRDLLIDAELRAESDRIVKTWLLDLNAVAYYAHDIVDDFRYAALQAEAETEDCQNDDNVRAGLFSCFKFICINLPFFNERESGVLDGIGYRVGRVVDRIDDLNERMKKINFQPDQEIIIAAERRHQLIFSSPAEINESTKYAVEILVQLPHPREHNHHLFIQGPHGIGKTVLTRFVCNDARINTHFERVVFVEVRPKFNIGRVTKYIIDQVIGKDCCISESNVSLLQLRFYQELKGKRYLLVLDDVQTDDVHQMLNFVLGIKMCGKLGSSVIVTTRFFEVATKFCSFPMGPSRIRLLELLPSNPEDQWNLFCKKVFSDGVCPTIFEEMGKKIMIICGGSPLVVNMMGGLMRFKKEREEWQGVIDQLEKILNNIGEEGVTVETIIKVCYDNLCSQVKQCFACCSLFPKGHYLDKEVLIKLWMANDLLLPLDGLTPLEEKGNNVFNELASRHFFEEVKLVLENYSYGNKHEYHSRVTFKMLDIIVDQAVIAAREHTRIISYLSISGDSRVDIPVLLGNNPDVRMLLCPDDSFSRTVNCSTVPSANSLRGLHLHSAIFERDLLELKYMTHLRYLDLSRSRIETLPEATSLLYFLETLNLSKCLFLNQLPKNMKYMRNLRHLYIHGCDKLKKMPAHFKQLGKLQTLTTYIVGENAGTGIDEIKDLQLGGFLELYNLRNVKSVEIAREANLVLKEKLDRLTLCWGNKQLIMPKENNDLEILEALQPHIELKVLKVQQYGGREFPTWLADPMLVGLVNLVEVHLIGCSQCKTLPAMWKLPSLRVICLQYMPSLTCLFCVDENYSSELLIPSLKKLVLVGLKRLERWHEGAATCSNLKTNFEEVTFPVLDELEITDCPNLKTMPIVPQLKHITITIENYRLLQSVTYLITQSGSLVEEANIAKASNDDNESFPALDAEVEGHVNNNLRIMRMDSTNSLFMPTKLRNSLLGLWKPFKSLRYLEIFNCNTLVFWPLEFEYLSSLIRLSIRMCPNLTGVLPAEAGGDKPLLPNLQKLEFYECSSLKQVPKCSSREPIVLELDECPEVESISGIHRLEMLYLSCTSWTSLPSGLGNLILLGTLWVSRCSNLTSLPDELASTIRIENLVISECPLLKELPGSFKEKLIQLKKLEISMCPDLEKFCKEGQYSSIISKVWKRSSTGWSIR